MPAFCEAVVAILPSLLYFKQLMNYYILYEQPYGFRQGFSTKLALIETTEQTRIALDNGELAMGIYLDLSKAFDTVNDKILNKNMEKYGLRGVAKDWFSSYLSERKQYTVLINNVIYRRCILQWPSRTPFSQSKSTFSCPKCIMSYCISIRT